MFLKFLFAFPLKNIALLYSCLSQRDLFIFISGLEEGQVYQQLLDLRIFSEAGFSPPE